MSFGIVSSVRAKNIKYNSKIFRSYELEILDSKDVIKFIREIGIFGKKENCDRVLVLAEKHQKVNNFSKDSIPIEIWEQILKVKGKLTWRQIYNELGLPLFSNFHVNKRNPKRATLLKIDKVLNSK